MAYELYVVAYDIRDPKRLKKMRRFLSRYFHSAQKSVFECFLSEQLLGIVLDGAAVYMDPACDCFCVSRIESPDPMLQVRDGPDQHELHFTYLG